MEDLGDTRNTSKTPEFYIIRMRFCWPRSDSVRNLLRISFSQTKSDLGVVIDLRAAG